LSTKGNKLGYKSFKLASGKVIYLHRLVAVAFLGPPPFPEAEACHDDGNPRNNRADNLRWDTHAENMRDIARHGRRAYGVRAGGVLPDTEALELRNRADAGSNKRELAEEYGVSVTTVYRLWRRSHWRHLDRLRGVTETPDGAEPPAARV
jgi:hypothetical protein